MSNEPKDGSTPPPGSSTPAPPSGKRDELLHDLGNALQTVLGATELARSGREKVDSCLQVIDVAVDHATNLLRMARRIEMAVPPRDDATRTVRDLRETLQLALGARHRLVVAVPSEPLVLTLSSVAITRVLLNAVLNVRQAIGVDAATVKVTLRRLDDELAQLVIEDDGPGVDDEAMDDWDRIDPVPSGRGTGLKSMRRIALEAGGAFSVETFASGGTRVSFELPMARG